MKYFLFVFGLIFFNNFYVFAQKNIYPFAVVDRYTCNFEPIQWKNLEVEDDKNERSIFLRKASKRNPILADILSTKKERLRCHDVDVNFDGLTDLIYAGRYPGGLEQDNVWIWINKNQKLELVFKVEGTLLDLKKDFLKKQITMQILDFPCCAQQFFISTTYVFPAKEEPCFVADNRYLFVSKKLCTTITNDIVFADNTIFPLEYLQVPREVRSKKYFYMFPKPNYITYTNIIENESYVLFSNRTKHKNIAFSLYLKDTKFSILAETNNKKGNKYYFVEIENDSQKPLRTHIYDCMANIRKGSKIRGWIKSNAID